MTVTVIGLSRLWGSERTKQNGTGNTATKRIHHQRTKGTTE
jgi:hypothetical protein